jgi:uncharacterized protein (DUF305 family)
MDKQSFSSSKSILYGIIGLIIGAVASGIIVSNQKTASQVATQPSPSVMQGMSHDMTGTTMTDMVNSLKDKTGDDFDRVFILGMIEHHEGAIDMANEAKKSAKHDEIKQMADDIISAQSKEIEQMREWQTDWGY